MTLLRVTYASLTELRTDEAYYWTWSKERALCFLDHPPMIAWFIRFGTAMFGDTNFGVRFAGVLAMLVTQVLLADIVRRVTHDVRAIVFAVLMPEAALYYGLLMAKVSPDTALIPFAVAMVWALVRLVEGNDARWWLAAGAFAGLGLLSKFTAILLSTSVLVPFCYFFWKSLTLRVGDTWPMFIWPIGFAAAAINIAMLPRENWSARMVGSTLAWAKAAIVSGIAFVVVVFLYYVAAPWNWIGRTDPVGGDAGYERLVERTQNELQKIGATRIATRDHR